MRMRQSGHGLLGPEGGALWGNKEGTSNWSVLMPAVSSRVAHRACCPRQWARVSWQWLCSPQLAPRDLGAAHLPLPPTVVGGPCLLPLLPTSISRLPPHHALSTPYPWKPGQHPNKELLGCVLEKKKKIHKSKPLWKTVWQFLTKLNILLPFNPSITLNQKELITWVHTKICTLIL